MSAVTETLAMFAGADSLIIVGAIVTGRLKYTTSRSRNRAGAAADTAPAAPAARRPVAVNGHARARSALNPGLAAVAAARRRDPVTGQFLREGRAS